MKISKHKYENCVLKTPQYENCEVLSPDGQLMFRCHKNKIDWYLSRGLGVKVADVPLTIKLTFIPKGDGHINDPYHLQKMINQCVVCGHQKYLTKHHVIPYCYRKFFPLQLKNHRHYDVLPLCIPCHKIYEDCHAMNFKKEIATKYSSPVDGIGVKYNKELKSARNAAVALLYWKDKIPLDRQKELTERVKLYLGKEPNEEDLKELNYQNPYNFDNSVHHGKMVVAQISDIQNFVQEWRQHFLDKMKPRFMPLNWHVDRPILQSPES